MEAVMRDRLLSRSFRVAITILISAIILTTIAWAQSTEKVLSKFPGASPQGLLNWDAQGHLYGNLATGTNVTRTGTVFELKQGSKGLWTKKVLYKFTGASDGGWPNGGMIFDGTGNLYGTGAAGGDVGDGVVFELVSGPNNTWTEQVLHSFSGTDGSLPSAGLIFDSAGNLYGTTAFGGASQGTVFELTPGPGGWTEKILHSFTEAEGLNPSGTLAFDSSGNLYGTTFRAGPHNGGSVFQLTPGQNGTWTLHTLHAFCTKANCADGSTPAGGLVADKKGNFYGTTREGGAVPGCANGCGTIFELVHKADGSWTHKVLYSFGNGSDGVVPSDDLAIDGSGNLFGTTSNPRGTAFELLLGPNNTRTFKLLYTFCSLANCADGQGPQGVILDPAGSLFGLTSSLAFEITP